MRYLKYTFMLVLLALTINANEIEWLSFEEAYHKAQTENKLILIDFYTDWCGWCKKMDKNTYTNNDVIDLMKNDFVAVKINPEKTGFIETDKGKIRWNQLASEIGVRGFPATAFFTSDFRLIDLISGYQDPQSMQSLLRFMSKKRFKQISFQDFRLYQEIQSRAEKDNSKPELDYLLGYFHLRFFNEKDKAYQNFQSALNKNLNNKELYAALYLSSSENEKVSQDWIAKAKEMGYQDESELDNLAVAYVKKLFKTK